MCTVETTGRVCGDDHGLGVVGDGDMTSLCVGRLWWFLSRWGILLFLYCRLFSRAGSTEFALCCVFRNDADLRTQARKETGR